MTLSKALFWPTTWYMAVGILVGALATTVSLPWWGLILAFIATLVVFVALDIWIDHIGERWKLSQRS